MIFFVDFVHIELSLIELQVDVLQQTHSMRWCECQF